MVTQTTFTAAAGVQRWLNAAWLKAEARLDDPAPLDAKFWSAMARFWERMEIFDAAEASARRSGATGCVSGGKCEGIVSCRACIDAP